MYRYSGGGEREQKRAYYSQESDSCSGILPWVYYLLDSDGEQLAVWHGRQTSEPDGCGGSGRRVVWYPVEYRSPGGAAVYVRGMSGDLVKELRMFDHLGSVRIRMKTTGNETVDYNPYGESRTGATSARTTFLDKEKDAENKNRTSDFSARKYEEKTGRFLRPDPLWGLTPGVSSYVYGNGSPVVYADPSGLSSGSLPNGDGLPQYVGQANNTTDNNKGAPGATGVTGGATGGGSEPISPVDKPIVTDPAPAATRRPRYVGGGDPNFGRNPQEDANAAPNVPDSPMGGQWGGGPVSQGGGSRGEPGVVYKLENVIAGGPTGPITQSVNSGGNPTRLINGVEVQKYDPKKRAETTCLPYLVNPTSSSVFISMEKGDDIFEVLPGQTVYEPIDGVATKLYKDKVFKVSAHQHVPIPVLVYNNLFFNGDVTECGAEIFFSWLNNIYKPMVGWQDMSNLSVPWTKLMRVANAIGENTVESMHKMFEK